MLRFKTSLAIGGTGMLSAATRWMAAESETTLLVARHASSFEAPPGVIPLDADWSLPSFEKRLAAVLQEMSAVEVALLWLHDPEHILAWLLPLLRVARVVLLLGSMDGRPETPHGARQFITVRLGSMRSAIGRRWLTHQEISAAAIAAIEDGRSRVVGDLRPVY